MKVSPFAADVEPPGTGSSLVGWSLVPSNTNRSLTIAGPVMDLG